MKKPFLFIIFLVLVSLAVPVPKTVELATDYTCFVEKDGHYLLHLDPLPPRADSIGRDLLNDYLEYIYPSLSINIGESIPVYLIPDYNSPKVLTFIISINSFDSSENTFKETTFKVIEDLCSQEAKVNSIKDEYYKKQRDFDADYNFASDEHWLALSSESCDLYLLRRAYMLIFVGFINDEIKILSCQHCNVFFKDTDSSSVPSDEFFAFGCIGYGNIYKLYKSDLSTVHLSSHSKVIPEEIEFYEGVYFPVPLYNPKTWDFYSIFNNISKGVQSSNEDNELYSYSKELIFYRVEKVGSGDCFLASHCARTIYEIKERNILFSGLDISTHDPGSERQCFYLNGYKNFLNENVFPVGWGVYKRDNFDDVVENGITNNCVEEFELKWLVATQPFAALYYDVKVLLPWNWGDLSDSRFYDGGTEYPKPPNYSDGIFKWELNQLLVLDVGAGNAHGICGFRIYDMSQYRFSYVDPNPEEPLPVNGTWTWKDFGAVHHSCFEVELGYSIPLLMHLNDDGTTLIELNVNPLRNLERYTLFIIYGDNNFYYLQLNKCINISYPKLLTYLCDKVGTIGVTFYFSNGRKPTTFLVPIPKDNK